MWQAVYTQVQTNARQPNNSTDSVRNRSVNGGLLFTIVFEFMLKEISEGGGGSRDQLMSPLAGCVSADLFLPVSNSRGVLKIFERPSVVTQTG